MSAHLVACPACERHVRVSEQACPFCTANLPESLRATPAPRLPGVRLKRAALGALSAGALTLTGCGGGVVGQANDAASDSVARDAIARDAVPDVVDETCADPCECPPYCPPYGIAPMPLGDAGDDAAADAPTDGHSQADDS